MKLFSVVLTLSLIASTYAGVDNSLREKSPRISSGIDSKKNENLDFCYLTVNFYNSFKRCGCFLWRDDVIITAGSCVVDAYDGIGTYFNVTFPALGLTYNASTTGSVFTEFDPKMPGVKDIAAVKLTTSVKRDTALAKTSSLDYAGTTKDYYANKVVRHCGFGRIYNNQTYTTTVKCVDLNVVASTDETCGVTANDALGCVKWTDRDNNACQGDIGGPLWLVSYSTLGVATDQKVIGIISYSPDARKGAATCQDGHSFYFTQLGTSSVQNFLNLYFTFGKV